MGKIKLGNEEILNIIKDGIAEAGDFLTLMLKDEKTVPEYDKAFSEEANTENISVLDYEGEVHRVYHGFTKMKKCGKVYDVVVDQTEGEEKEPIYGNAVEILLYRPSDIEERLEIVEEELKKGSAGISEELMEAVLVVVQNSAQGLPDQLALKAKAIYETFNELVKRKFTAEKKGYIFRDGEVLYKTAQDNISFVEHYRPGQGTESMFTVINEEHAGTLEDPIPYAGNMELEKDKYYIQDGVVYLCWNPSGIAVFDRLENLTTFVRKV